MYNEQVCKMILRCTKGYFLKNIFFPKEMMYLCSLLIFLPPQISFFGTKFVPLTSRKLKHLKAADSGTNIKSMFVWTNIVREGGHSKPKVIFLFQLLHIDSYVWPRKKHQTCRTRPKTVCKINAKNHPFWLLQASLDQWEAPKNRCFFQHVRNKEGKLFLTFL